MSLLGVISRETSHAEGTHIWTFSRQRHEGVLICCAVSGIMEPAVGKVTEGYICVCGVRRAPNRHCDARSNPPLFPPVRKMGQVFCGPGVAVVHQGGSVRK